MLRNKRVPLRWIRFGALGLVTIAATVIATDNAEARRHRHRHHVRHHVERYSYSPAFASIVVDANSGAILASSNPDSIRHPASLTKIMTLYMLFERLESGKIKLDTEMPVSAHASEQAPTKLGLRPGQSIRVEDAIKGLVTRSANDAAVVIAETLAGDEEEFAAQMTRKARSLGMARTTYRNASGLPDDEQVTTARDQATLGRAIQDRFPRYYRYFATASFNFRGQSIRNHNRLLGNVEGVDGIKTGYTRASGFNLVTSMKRGNRHLVGVVLGGRSGGSRDAIMRNLLAENLEKASTRRTVAAIAERDGSPAETEAETKPAPVQVASAEPAAVVQRPAVLPSPPAAIAAAAPAADPNAQAKPKVLEPAPMTSGVISAPMSLLPGSTEPMKPVKVKTVQVKAGGFKLASATQPAMAAAPQPTPPAPIVTSSVQPPASGPRTDTARIDRPESSRPAETAARTELPAQPAGHGTGQGLLGVLPASGSSSVHQAMAYAEPARPQPTAAPAASTPAPQTAQQDSAAKSAPVRSGWIVQVGALETEGEAQQRIEAARTQAHGLLNKAEPFTEPVVAKGERKLFRARFAGLERDKAEAVCKTLKRADISCITVRN